MRAWTAAAAATLWAASAFAADPSPGRTDGPEGSEIGKGGYPYAGIAGAFSVAPILGAAMVESDRDSETDLMYGLNVGWRTEDWLGVHASYAFILDQQTNLFGVGVRNILEYEPFNYHLSLDAELYSPSEGDTNFGLAPGVGAEVLLNDNLSLGLQYQRDFIFSDESIGINRFTARMAFRF